MARGPARGDVLWLELGSGAGHEQSGRRPALVVSPDAYNARVGLALVCPITGRVKGYPFEVPVPADLPVEGVVLADQVRSIDWRVRRAERACTLPLETVREVQHRLEALIEP